MHPIYLIDSLDTNGLELSFYYPTARLVWQVPKIDLDVESYIGAYLEIDKSLSCEIFLEDKERLLKFQIYFRCLNQ